MATEQNNAHITTFTDGMNTDTGYNILKSSNYTMSVNNRITTTKYTDSSDDSYSNQKEGVLAPVQIDSYKYTITAQTEGALKDYNMLNKDYVYKILTSGSTSIILYKNYNAEKKPILNVGRLRTGANQQKYIYLLFCVELPTDLKNISAVLNEEQSDVVNLYIATGSTQLLQINVVDEDYILKLQEAYTDDKGAKVIDQLDIDIDDIMSNSYFPYDKIIIEDQIYGQLKTSQVQYTYRFYKKHGVCSKLAPLTNKIQVISANKNQETGCAEDTVTSVGFRLKIDADIIKDALKRFDRLQIYRISYIKINTDAEVKLVFDGKFDEAFGYDDIKQEGVQELTMEEFSNISGLSLQPNVISQNQKYLFCGDVTDTTIIDFNDFGGVTENDVKTWYRTYRLSSDAKINEYNFQPFTEGQDEVPIQRTQEELYEWIWNKTESHLTDPYNYMNIYDKMDWQDCTESRKMEYIKNPSSRSERYNIYGLLGGTGRYINWEFVFTPIPSCGVSNDLWTQTDISSTTPHSAMCFYHQWNSSFYYQGEYNRLVFNYIMDDYLESKKIKPNSKLSERAGGYSDNIISSVVRSLRRGEVYRYGIVFYDKYGSRTNVFWIQDIRTPGIYDTFVDVCKEKNTKSTSYGKATGLTMQTYVTDSTGAPTTELNSTIYSMAVGIKFDVTIPQALQDIGIIGYEIVRCEKNITNTRNMYQAVLSRPVQKTLPYGEKSPYHPTGFITTQPCRVVPKNLGSGATTMGPKASTDSITENLKWQNSTRDEGNAEAVYANYPEKQLFQCFCPDYYIYNKDVLNNVISSQVNIVPQCYINSCDYTDSDLTKLNKIIYYDSDRPDHRTLYHMCYWANNVDQSRKYITIDKRCFYVDKSTKLDNKVVIPLSKACLTINLRELKEDEDDIVITNYNLAMKLIGAYDSKNAGWSDGFEEIESESGYVSSGVAKYKTFVTNASTYSYLNWVCSNKYDYPIGADPSAEKPAGWNTDNWKRVGEFNSYMSWDGSEKNEPWTYARGPIGPAGPCMAVVVKMPTGTGGDVKYTYDSEHLLDGYLAILNDPSNLKYPLFGTFLCNVQHTPVQFAGITEAERQYDTYYGFGNYVHATDFKKPVTNIVFDGDVYPDAQEIYTMFKAYDFQDTSAFLQSVQILYYIPMESAVNWRFDYGMHYANEGSTNLQLEPGEITGVCAQERKLRQYNSIYSDNNTSNNIYNTTSIDDSVNTYHQRLFYSELKTPGENIDNWQIFKSVNCIDCNSEFGSITDLFTFKDTLYVWQDRAFSKLSVNERSLVKDENSNTIQLGQGDVLQRVDYISTNYGMRQYDMCKINAEGVLYWFDYHNKCIAALSEGSVIDYTNTKNIKSLMQNYKDVRNPQLAYDQSHKELLFGTIDSPISSGQNAVLVMNTEMNVPMGLYYLKHSNVLQYDKDCISISGANVSGHSGNIDSYSVSEDAQKIKDCTQEFLMPTYIQFVVNSDPSVTKVFDNQMVVTGKRECFLDKSVDESFFMNKTMSLDTNLCKTEIKGEDLATTDREGNIKYALPRYNNEEEYGSRIRGKYMIESILDEDPNKESTISHIITRYRTSYS